MVLGDIYDMSDYLENRCYCAGEIYDCTGFFFQIFNKDEECRKVIEVDRQCDNEKVVCVICRNQLINIWINSDNKVSCAERYDAMENNITMMKEYWEGKIDGSKVHLDEFTEGETERSLNNIMKYADAILIC